MSESSLAQFVGTAGKRRPATVAAKADDEQDYRAFSFGRVGLRPQIRIELRKSDGYHLMLAYVDLKTVETMNPENGFVLSFPSFKITIEGQNLTDCYNYLATDRVATIVEATRGLVLSTPASEPLITAIKLERAMPGR